ncbi:MAG: MlaD family protein [Planctomycetota bacterium]
MNDRRLEFRVGLLTVAAIGVAMALTVAFGRLDTLFGETYAIAVHYPQAPGVVPGVPVRKNGVTVGSVREIRFDDEQGGVVAVLSIRADVRFRSDAEAVLTRTLLGDSSIDFVPGAADTFLTDGTRIEGTSPADPFALVGKLERRIEGALGTLEETARSWTTVAVTANTLIEDKRPDVDRILGQTSDALVAFRDTAADVRGMIADFDSLVADPETRAALKQTLLGLPKLVDETRGAVHAARATVARVEQAVGSVDGLVGDARDAVTGINRTVAVAERTVTNFETMSRPLAARAGPIAAKLDATLAHLEVFGRQIATFSELLNEGDGTAQRLVRDPQLYRNLNNSAESLAILLANIQPVIADLRVFSDKIARHPELIGVRGVVRGSDGTKSANEGVVPATAERPSPNQPTRSARRHDGSFR